MGCSRALYDVRLVVPLHEREVACGHRLFAERERGPHPRFLRRLELFLLLRILPLRVEERVAVLAPGEHAPAPAVSVARPIGDRVEQCPRAVVLDGATSLLLTRYVAPFGDVLRDLAARGGVDPAALPAVALEEPQDRELGKEVLAVEVDHRCGLLAHVVGEGLATPEREPHGHTRDRAYPLAGRPQKRVGEIDHEVIAFDVRRESGKPRGISGGHVLRVNVGVMGVICHPERQRGTLCASLVASHAHGTEDPSLRLGMTGGVDAIAIAPVFTAPFDSWNTVSIWGQRRSSGRSPAA